MSSPDMWREPERLAFPWLGACACGRLRRTHVVRDALGQEDVVGRCDAGHETDLADHMPSPTRHLRALRDAAIDRQAERRPFDPTVLIDVVHDHLDAIAGLVDSDAKLDPHAASSEVRVRLVEVECLVNQALRRFSSAEHDEG